MEKLAQLKEAEVCGVLSALVDKGLLPVNSPKQFEKVAAYMSNAVDGYDYSLVDLVGAAEDAMKKTAFDFDEAKYHSPEQKKFDMGMGSGAGLVLGSNLGVEGMHKLLSKGILRSPKSKLLRSLLSVGSGVAGGLTGGVAGGVAMGKAFDSSEKAYKAKKSKQAKE